MNRKQWQSNDNPFQDSYSQITLVLAIVILVLIGLTLYTAYYGYTLLTIK